jgi:hypothetical protein
MLTHKKVNPSTTAFFAVSILDTICKLDSNKLTDSVGHRVRELVVKLKKISNTKVKPDNSKKYLEGAIKRSLEIRELAKEIEELAGKIGKLHDKVILPDIKNAIHLAKSAAKSALESIKVNKITIKSL